MHPLVYVTCIKGADAFIVLSLMEISSPNLSSYYNYDTVIHGPMRSINIISSSPQLHGGSDQYYQFEQHQQEQPSSPHIYRKPGSIDSTRLGMF
jgi:hypothetical protein